MNRFFTLMLIPEKTKQVRRLVIPNWILQSSLVFLLLFSILAVMMTLDYWYVLSRLSENKDLQIENRKLKQQLQVYRSQIYTIQDTMDRVENFANRLRVITNIEDRKSQQSTPLPPSSDPLQNTTPSSPAAPSSENKSSMNRMNPLRFLAPKEAWAQNTLEDKNITEVKKKNSEKIYLIESSSQLTDEKLITLLEDLKKSSHLIEENLLDLYEVLTDKKDFLAAYPTLRPTPGRLSSGFDVRVNPYLRRVRMHEGIDIANQPGTAIFATAHGVVLFAGLKAGYGNTVIIEHGYGIQTLYAHNNRVLVKKGDLIRRGDRIALMGSTGHSTGPHLHYEIHINEVPVDPEAYILEF